jgi:hypothetical protein
MRIEQLPSLTGAWPTEFSLDIREKTASSRSDRGHLFYKAGYPTSEWQNMTCRH